MIARHGHKVAEAQSGAEFLQKMAGGTGGLGTLQEGEAVSVFADMRASGSAPSYSGMVFDVILVDHHMSKMNGPEATR